MLRPSRLLSACARPFPSSSSRAYASSSVVPLHAVAMPAAAAAAAAAADATPLVFIHGLLGSATNFRAVQSRAARAGRATLAVDLRDHGASPHTDAAAGERPSTLLDYARDVAAAIAARAGGGPVDVIGHSLGGKTAMVLALTRPALVRRVAVVDIAPVAYAAEGAHASSAWRDVAAVVRAAHALDAAQFRSRQAVDARLAESVADAGVRSFVCQNLLAQADGSYRWRHNSAALLASLPHFASFPDAAALRAEAAQAAVVGVSPPPGAEVHFVSGERSGYVRPHHHARIRELFPAAVLHAPIAGAGHWVHADRPAEFWALVARIMRIEEGV